MFFWIEGALDFTQANQVNAVENLGEAGFAGRHLVLGDVSVIDQIISQAGLSKKSLAYFRSVKSRYAQVAALKRFIPRIKVSASCLVAHRGDGWTVPLDSFRTDDSVEKSLILVEHMYDYKVIEGLAKTSLREKGLNGWVKISLMPVSGGGGGTSLALSVHQQNMRSIGICVVDSDRIHVRAALGSTAKGCEKIYEQRWGWGLHILGGRELENLIPPGVFLAGGVNFNISKNGHYSDADWPIYGFTDTKKGDCLCRFRSIDAGNLSYRETLVALSRLPAPSANAVCPSRDCLLCEKDEGALAVLANNMDAYTVSGLKAIPSPVFALTNLLKEVIGFGAAPKWSMI